MKKKSGWIAFFIDINGKIALHGSDMYPEIYDTKRLALIQMEGNPDYAHKIKCPQPIKIEWKE